MVELEYNHNYNVVIIVQSPENKHYCVFISLECVFHIYRGSRSTILHCHVSTVAQNGQTKCWLSFFVSFMDTVGSPRHLKGEGVRRDIHSGVIFNLTARCPWILHTGPSKSIRNSISRVGYLTSVSWRHSVVNRINRQDRTLGKISLDCWKVGHINNMEDYAKKKSD